MISIVRKDLSPGQQLAQASHSLIQFQQQNKKAFNNWFKTSNYILFLSCENELELKRLVIRFEKKGLKLAKFYEPDLDNQLTSITLEPCELSKKLTSSLPLAMKGVKNG